MTIEKSALDTLVVQQLPAVFSAALHGDSHQGIVAIRRFIAKLRDISPDLAEQLNQAVFSQDTESRSALRRATPLEEISPPTDPDNHSPLFRLIDCSEAQLPIVSEGTYDQLVDFIAEHEAADLLIQNGLMPRGTLFFTGPPGTGKTMLASWIASRLNLPLIQFEISTAISSYLGRTGQNIKEILDYAKFHQVVLLLDEFDAVAKRRDDHADLGELKRIVSVLLKELEEWPGPSIIIAATNHPALIDPAIFRRFQIVLEIPLPDESAAIEILRMHLAPEVASEKILQFAGKILSGVSGSDIRNLAYNARRSLHLKPEEESLDGFILMYLAGHVQTKAQRKEFIHIAQTLLSRKDRTLSRLASLLNVGTSTVHRYLNESR